MFDINVRIERIRNGFIVTSHDCNEDRMYFPSLESFVEAEMLSAAKAEDKYFRENNTRGVVFDVRAITSEHMRKSSIVDIPECNSAGREE